MTKEERAAYNKAYREANCERLRVQEREWRIANSERIKTTQRAYNRTVQRKAMQSAYKKQKPEATKRSNELWQKRNPDKLKAQQKFHEAVRRGKVARPSACSKCGGGGVIDGHHPNYSKPLEVEFLCRPCHVAQHRETQCPTT